MDTEKSNLKQDTKFIMVLHKSEASLHIHSYTSEDNTRLLLTHSVQEKEIRGRRE